MAMTPERLAHLRFLANFATYHVPRGTVDETLLDADAGDDMVALCDAVAASAALLASCKELREALEAAMQVIATADFTYDHDVLTEEFVTEMARRSIAPGIGVRAKDAIAQAEGKPRRVEPEGVLGE
jgi:hypothetical protein